MGKQLVNLNVGDSNIEVFSEGLGDRWCVSCARVLQDDDIHITESSVGLSTVFYAKFDLPRSVFSKFAELSELNKKMGAIRISLVAGEISHSTLRACNGLVLNSELEYVAIKVPTLEGTEIWIVSKASQENVEMAMGFDRVSDPLLIFKPEIFQRQVALHPICESDMPIYLSSHFGSKTGTGVTLAELVHAEKRALAYSSTKENLIESGHWAAEVAAICQITRCRICGEPTVLKINERRAEMSEVRESCEEVIQ